MNYFAYGSNMDCTRMKRRCPGAILNGLASLPTMAFQINERGYATVVPSPAETVFGLLWTITSEDEERLDEYEAVGAGLYTKQQLRVHPAIGPAIEALVYVAVESGPGRPRPGYLENVLRAGEEQGLPAAYLESIRRRIEE